MDAIDRKILGLLQEDASRSVAEIGNLVGLSSTPCWKRIQRLEADGVIQRRGAAVGPDKNSPGRPPVGSVQTGGPSPPRPPPIPSPGGAPPPVVGGSPPARGGRD